LKGAGFSVSAGSDAAIDGVMAVNILKRVSAGGPRCGGRRGGRGRWERRRNVRRGRKEMLRRREGVGGMRDHIFLGVDVGIKAKKRLGNEMGFVRWYEGEQLVGMVLIGLEMTKVRPGGEEEDGVRHVDGECGNGGGHCLSSILHPLGRLLLLGFTTGIPRV